MNEQIGNKINDKTYIKLTPFKGFVLENFPFIEADFDAITNYQLLCKVIEYLNNVISNQNTVQELGTDLVNAYNSLVDAVNLAINEFETDVTADINQFKVDINNDFDDFTSNITTQFNNLHDYVYNYFNNLDVQNEIDNKLDEMVQDGTLQEIITDYLNTRAIFCYENVAGMKQATNLINGSYAKTLGYYNNNDGGGSLYYIRNTVPTNEYYETLNSGLYAQLIPGEYVNSKQVGLKGDETDETSLLQTLVNIYKRVILKAGTYYITDQLLLNNIKELKGEDGAVIKASDESTVNYKDSAVLISGNTNYKISNIKIVCVRNTTNTFTGLRTHQSSFGIYENIEVTGSTMGLYTTQSNNILINKCYIHDTSKDGCTISDGSTCINVTNCKAVNTGDDSFAVVSYTGNTNICSDIKFIGNTAIDCKKRSYLVDGGENINISNNYALNSKNNLICICGNTVWNTRLATDVVVNGNICELTTSEGLEIDSLTAMFGIQGAANVTFTNNRFDMSAILDDETERHQDNTIQDATNVIFANNYINGNGIKLRRVNTISFDNNTIRNAYNNGLYITRTDNFIFTNNRIIDYVYGNGSYKDAINVYYEVIDGVDIRNSNFVIANNYYYTSKSYLMDLQVPFIDGLHICENPTYKVNVENSTNVSFANVYQTTANDTILTNSLVNGTIVSNANGVLRVKTSSGIKTITTS